MGLHVTMIRKGSGQLVGRLHVYIYELSLTFDVIF